MDGDGKLIEERYDYNHGKPFEKLKEILDSLEQSYSREQFKNLSFTGTGGKLAADLLTYIPVIVTFRRWSLRRRFDSDRAVPKVRPVQVLLKNLVLRQQAFEPDRENRFADLCAPPAPIEGLAHELDGLLRDGGRTATVTAVVPSSALLLPTHTFIEAISTSPATIAGVMRELAKRVRQQNLVIESDRTFSMMAGSMSCRVLASIITSGSS